MVDRKLFGGIDAGGTKFLCAVGSSPDHIEDMTIIPTTHQEETLGRVVAFFQHHEKRLAGLGVSCFGPLNRVRGTKGYGSLINSPKDGWKTADIAGYLCKRLPAIPFSIDTDVNGAALAERRWGVAKALENLAYVTVGTGVGVGIMSNGTLVSGRGHPELGHFKVPRHVDDPPYSFAGLCPYHRDCLEGLTAGPALRARFNNTPPEQLSNESPIWPVVADYLAHLSTVLILTFSLDCVVFGGGIMKREILFPMVRRATKEKLNGYLSDPLYNGNFQSVIRRSEFLVPLAGRPNINAGVLGGFILAAQAAGVDIDAV